MQPSRLSDHGGELLAPNADNLSSEKTKLLAERHADRCTHNESLVHHLPDSSSNMPSKSDKMLYVFNVERRHDNASYRLETFETFDRKKKKKSTNIRLRPLGENMRNIVYDIISAKPFFIVGRRS